MFVSHLRITIWLLSQLRIKEWTSWSIMYVSNWHHHLAGITLRNTSFQLDFKTLLFTHSEKKTETKSLFPTLIIDQGSSHLGGITVRNRGETLASSYHVSLCTLSAWKKNEYKQNLLIPLNINICSDLSVTTDSHHRS